eukprot:CAMPEP_0179420306 /NCGR_PEP_ID=MMETSP0799-20121207/9094_1 /TAXON_ID=46947 /ORGANISM="Geminigera cryophila, Strain CCMP2564" /LENGTH=342 /DNA_ID=CAMNT_0021193901 /DNA_START=29 /DNA_END=1057 /DNA_ORIENTATION=+
MTRLDLINKMLLVVVTVESNTGGWAPTEANLIPSSSCIGAICRDYQTSSLQLRGGGACFPFQPRPPARDIDNLNNMLLKASASGSTKMVRKLIEEGAKVEFWNDQLQTPLLVASEKGRLNTLLALVECGANMHHTDNKKSNALHYAAYNGHCDTIKSLIEMGVPLNACNHFGYSPLQYACADGDMETVHLLLSLGAQVHSQDKMGWTALHRAAGNGHPLVVQVLLEFGALVNFRDVQNYTALHEATWCGHAEIVRTLVEAGAEIEQQDSWGNSPLDLAFSQSREGNEEVYAILVQALGEKSREMAAVETEPFSLANTNALANHSIVQVHPTIPITNHQHLKS